MPQQFNEMLHGEFPISYLAAGLLRYESKDSVLADASLKAAQDKLCLLRRKASGFTTSNHKVISELDLLKS